LPMLAAISAPEVAASNGRTEPSGKVMFGIARSAGNEYGCRQARRAIVQ